MKKHPLTLTLITLFLFVASPVLFADVFQGEAGFDPNDLTITPSFGFDHLLLKDGGYDNPVGAPAVPHQQVHVALPFGVQALGLNILQVETMELPGAYDLKPTTKARPISSELKTVEFFKDGSIYGQDSFYPQTRGELAASWDLYGQDFVTLKLYPIQYNPKTQKVLFATRIVFEVIYQEKDNPIQKTFNFSNKTKKHLMGLKQSFAFNPAGVLPILSNSSRAPGDTEYVIITTPSFKNAFQPLADWRTQMGIPAKIVETTWIYSNYTGSNNQAKIRNFVKDAQANWGTLYFLIGGDSSHVPCSYKQISFDNIANDTYYADYDDDWIIEAFIGRACVNNNSQINTFVNKALSYEKTPPSQFGDTACFLGFDANSMYHGEEATKIIEKRYLPSYTVFCKEYDSEPGAHKSDVTGYINQGQNLIAHLDHGDFNYIGAGLTNHGGSYSINEAKGFNNGFKQSSFNTVSCLTAKFTTNCWAENFVLDDTGGITYVGNTSYGLFDIGNYASLSQLYQQNWFQALWEKNVYLAGEVLALSKNMHYPSDTNHKFCWYELHLLGDPALHTWTKDPKDLTVTHATSINTGSQTFNVNVKDSGANLEGALVCLMKGTEVYNYDLTDASGNVNLTIDPATVGTMTVTVTARNFKYYEGPVNVTAGTLNPQIYGVAPKCGLEAGATFVTVTGANFTADVKVKVGGVLCTGINVINSSSLTCNTPAGANGWEDVLVSNSIGSDTLVDGFRYFPALGLPFNAADIHTEALDAPVDVTLIFSGSSQAAFMSFYSFGNGPVTTPYGIMGLSIPFYNLISMSLNTQGYQLVPLTIPAGYGPLDLYIHSLGPNGSGQGVWAYGGNDPSQSIWIHLNN